MVQQLTSPSTITGSGTAKLAPAYTVYRSGSTYYAVDADGNQSSNSNFATLMNTISATLSAAGGGLIFIKNGIYTWASGAIILFIRSNVSIVGESREGTIIQIPMDIASSGAAIKNEHFNTGTDSFWSLENMTLDGQAASQPNLGYIVEVCGVTNGVFRNLHIKNAKDWGILIYGTTTHIASHILVEGCFGENCYDNAIIAKGDAAGQCEHISVVNNHVTNCDTGIAFMDVFNSLIANNICWSNNNQAVRTNGIDICLEGAGSANGCKNVTVTGNVCDGQNAANAKSGISILKANNCVISNNVVRNHVNATGGYAEIDAHGSYVTDNIFMGNNVNTGKRGFVCKSDANRNNFIGNFVDTCEQGFQIGESDTAGRLNFFLKNLLKDCSSYGFRLQLSRAIIKNNIIIDTSAKANFSNSGINLANQATISNTTIEDNYIENLASAINITGANVNAAYVYRNWYKSCTAGLTDSGTGTQISGDVTIA